MQDEHPIGLGTLRTQRRASAPHQSLVGNREHREVERRIHQAARLIGGDVDAQLLEQPQDRAGLGRAGRIVVAGDEHDRRAGQRLAEPLELPEGEDDRGVGRADGVEQIPGHDDRVRARRDDVVHRQAEGVRDVGLALIDAGGGLPVVLPDAEVRVGDMGEFHL